MDKYNHEYEEFRKNIVGSEVSEREIVYLYMVDRFKNSNDEYIKELKVKENMLLNDLKDVIDKIHAYMELELKIKDQINEIQGSICKKLGHILTYEASKKNGYIYKCMSCGRYVRYNFVRDNDIIIENEDYTKRLKK